MGESWGLETVIRLKLGAHVHTVTRKSATAFDVDGNVVETLLSSNEPGRFDARPQGAAHRVYVVRDGNRVMAQVDGRDYNLTVVGRAASGASSEHAADGGLEAPMPGRVTRVAVSVGDKVKKGQELIVVEAMKMENALTAPDDGVVASLTVKVGDMVAPGSALVVIEALS